MKKNINHIKYLTEVDNNELTLVPFLAEFPSVVQEWTSKTGQYLNCIPSVE